MWLIEVILMLLVFFIGAAFGIITEDRTLKKWFDKDCFFIKLSPINKNVISEKNNLGDGYVEGINLV